MSMGVPHSNALGRAATLRAGHLCFYDHCRLVASVPATLWATQTWPLLSITTRWREGIPAAKLETLLLRHLTGTLKFGEDRAAKKRLALLKL